MLMSQNQQVSFSQQYPELALRLERQGGGEQPGDGLDGRTRQLIMIGVQASGGNVPAVQAHAELARAAGASWDEVVDAVVMQLHLSDLVPTLECLQAAIDGYGQNLG
jgi:AhpD family alkylhydroperoxidase